MRCFKVIIFKVQPFMLLLPEHLSLPLARTSFTPQSPRDRCGSYSESSSPSLNSPEHFLHFPFPFWHSRTIFIFHVTDSRLDSPSSHTRGVSPAVTNAPSFQGEIHTPRPQPLHCSVFAPPLLGPHTCSSRSLECSPPFSDNSVH